MNEITLPTEDRAAQLSTSELIGEVRSAGSNKTQIVGLPEPFGAVNMHMEKTRTTQELVIDLFMDKGDSNEEAKKEPPVSLIFRESMSHKGPARSDDAFGATQTQETLTIRLNPVSIDAATKQRLAEAGLYPPDLAIDNSYPSPFHKWIKANHGRSSGQPHGYEAHSILKIVV